MTRADKFTDVKIERKRCKCWTDWAAVRRSETVQRTVFMWSVTSGSLGGILVYPFTISWCMNLAADITKRIHSPQGRLYSSITNIRVISCNVGSAWFSWIIRIGTIFRYLTPLKKLPIPLPCFHISSGRLYIYPQIRHRLWCFVMILKCYSWDINSFLPIVSSFFSTALPNSTDCFLTVFMKLWRMYGW